jgi:alpha-ketoglutarate-dependent taurine dioxygenase
MPSDIMDDLDAIFADVSVAVKWQKGDVILADNRLVLHARNTFKPPRRILASLVK